MVAGYFALASGEMLPPGTMQWVLGGGDYAAVFALPLAALVAGFIGLLDPARRGGNSARWRMRTIRRITAARVDDDDLVECLHSGLE